MPDAYTLNHLAAWLDNHIGPEDYEDTLNAMLALIARDPEYALSHSWEDVARAAGVPMYQPVAPVPFYQRTVRC